MLLRHGPGDSDFDDITQIKQNANRAANLVRQLLAFSRQQTLRPQVLQISDVVGELSHLLKRLLGERITLTVKHGRRSEDHTSELQSLMRISYAVFCLKKKTNNQRKLLTTHNIT